MDGNKRTGYVLMRILLLEDGKTLNAEEDEKYDFVIRIASGKLSYDQILEWIKAHVEWVYGGLVFQYFEDNKGDIEGVFKEAEVV